MDMDGMVRRFKDRKFTGFHGVRYEELAGAQRKPTNRDWLREAVCSASMNAKEDQGPPTHGRVVPFDSISIEPIETSGSKQREGSTGSGSEQPTAMARLPFCPGCGDALPTQCVRLEADLNGKPAEFATPNYSSGCRWKVIGCSSTDHHKNSGRTPRSMTVRLWSGPASHLGNPVSLEN
jgi:hypothetical protein